MSKVLITGGTGMIGQRLVQLLSKRGHRTVLLSRSPDPARDIYGWDLEKRTVDPEAFKGVEYIIHLAGAGIADEKWTEKRKQEIIDSRVVSAAVLAEHCEKHKVRLRGFLSASAIGYYPLNNHLPPQPEDAPPGQSFLSKVCVAWEESADAFRAFAEFVTKVRIGLVLANEGGAMSKLVPPVKFFVGAALGSGKQAMPWIHVDDVCNIFIHLMEKELGGTYNAVGPEITDNNNFMQTLADVMDRPLLFANVPEFAIRIVAGQMADLVLKGAPVSSTKIQKTGFHFDFPTLNTALSDLLVE